MNATKYILAALGPHCDPEYAKARVPEIVAIFKRGGTKRAIKERIRECISQLDISGQVQLYCRDLAVDAVYTVYLIYEQEANNDDVHDPRRERKRKTSH